jgi:hypothetical protein
MQNPEPERGASIQAEHLPPVLQQGERLGILALHDLERGSRSREGIYQGIHNYSQHNYGTVVTSVADPGCLSRILDPNFVPSQIQGQKDFGSRIRVRIKEFKYFNPKNCFLRSRKYVLGSSSRIPYLDLDFFTHPGSRIKGSKRHRI